MNVFGSIDNLKSILLTKGQTQKIFVNNDINEYLGDKETIAKSILLFNRRKQNLEMIAKRRKTDKTGMKISDAVKYVENKLKIKIHKLSYASDKNILIQIAIILRDECLLSYRDIQLIPPFNLVNNNTLKTAIFRNSKK